MAINNIQTQQSNAGNIYQKYTEKYRASKPEKKEIKISQKSNPHLDEMRDLSPSELKDFLSSDEKKVLKEVFGDLAVDKYSNNLYNSSKSTDLLKGSQIDIKL